MGVCSCTFKYSLIVFNLVCAICGIIILIIGAVSINNGGSFSGVINGQVKTVAICLIVLGGIIFVISFFGCCGAVREDTCMIRTYAVLLLVIIILEVTIGITAFVVKGKLENEIEHSLERYFENYTKHKSTIDDIQTSLKCCGYDGPSFWNNKIMMIPNSCCSSQSGCTLNNSFQEGCLDAIKSESKKMLGIIGGVVLGIAVIELVGCVGGFIVANHIKKQQRRGYA